MDTLKERKYKELHDKYMKLKSDYEKLKIDYDVLMDKRFSQADHLLYKAKKENELVCVSTKLVQS